MGKFNAIVILFSYFSAWSQAIPEHQPVNSNNSAPSSVQGVIIQEQKEMDTLMLEEKTIIKTEATSKKAKAEAQGQSRSNTMVSDATSASVMEYTTSAAAQSFNFAQIQTSNSRTQRTPKPELQQQMDAAVKSLEKNAPASFEYNLYRYQAGNHDVNLVDNLKKAEQLNPKNVDVQVQMAAFNWIVADTLKSLEYLQKMIEVNRLTDEMLTYSNDLLVSVPENGTLITHGYDDSFSAFYQQNETNTREDVTIVPLELMQSSKLKDEMKKKGYTLPDNPNIDVNYLKSFCELNTDKSVVISMTVPKEYLTAMGARLFVSGLVFEYRTEQDFNNFLRNDEIWQKMNKILIEAVKTEKGRQLTANYLPMLLHLSRVYGELNEPKKKQEIDLVIDKVAGVSNKTEQIKKLRAN
jgi:hypothetical protein